MQRWLMQGQSELEYCSFDPAKNHKAAWKLQTVKINRNMVLNSETASRINLTENVHYVQESAIKWNRKESSFWTLGVNTSS
jgi:hypothetical protein